MLLPFNSGVNQTQLQRRLQERQPCRSGLRLGGSCQANTHTICSTSSRVLPGYKPLRSAVYSHGLRVLFRFTEGSLHSSLFVSFSKAVTESLIKRKYPSQ